MVRGAAYPNRACWFSLRRSKPGAACWVALLCLRYNTVNAVTELPLHKVVQLDEVGAGSGREQPSQHAFSTGFSAQPSPSARSSGGDIELITAVVIEDSIDPVSAVDAVVVVASPMFSAAALRTAQGLDTNGDGLPDVIGLDSTGDGTIDTMLPGVPRDTNGDGFLDSLGADTNGDGAPDVFVKIFE